jgi:hypothetical protein
MLEVLRTGSNPVLVAKTKFMANKKKKNTAYIDRDGNLSIDGTFNFEGSLLKLKEIIEDTIEEYGEDTKCKLDLFGRFPHNWSSHLIITNKKHIHHENRD